MLNGLVSKHFSVFHFDGKNSHMTCKSKAQLSHADKLVEEMPHRMRSLTTSKAKKESGTKEVKPLSIIPSTRYNKRRSEDGGTPKNSTTSALRRLISSRSFSHPGHKRRSDDNQIEGCILTSQMSLFQSPFDYETDDDRESYRYDVNISYHKTQQKWVEKLLLPILEKELGLRCYLHDRDNLPGISTVKNIAAAVRESRITILCFSKDYLKSSWQNYEALLAHHMDPGGWKKRILPIVAEDCALPFKYTVCATLKWPEWNGRPTETVPAPVKLRRKFFISGLLIAVGTHSKERALEIFQKYCALNVPVTDKPAISSNYTVSNGQHLSVFENFPQPT